MAVEGNTRSESAIARLEERVKTLVVAMEKMKLAEYMELLERPWRLMYINFIAGIARGFGIAIGFTILGAIVVYFLRRVLMANLPGIGKFIAEIVRIVNLHLY